MYGVDGDYDGQYTPTQSYNNVNTQDAYVDDAKDLHFSHQHGSHSTEYSHTHGNGGGQSR